MCGHNEPQNAANANNIVVHFARPPALNTILVVARCLRSIPCCMPVSKRAQQQRKKDGRIKRISKCSIIPDEEQHNNNKKDGMGACASAWNNITRARCVNVISNNIVCRLEKPSVRWVLGIIGCQVPGRPHDITRTGLSIYKIMEYIPLGCAPLVSEWELRLSIMPICMYCVY